MYLRVNMVRNHGIAYSCITDAHIRMRLCPTNTCAL